MERSGAKALLDMISEQADLLSVSPASVKYNPDGLSNVSYSVLSDSGLFKTVRFDIRDYSLKKIYKLVEVDDNSVVLINGGSGVSGCGITIWFSSNLNPNPSSCMNYFSYYANIRIDICSSSTCYYNSGIVWWPPFYGRLYCCPQSSSNFICGDFSMNPSKMPLPLVGDDLSIMVIDDGISDLSELSSCVGTSQISSRTLSIVLSFFAYRI